MQGSLALRGGNRQDIWARQVLELGSSPKVPLAAQRHGGCQRDVATREIIVGFELGRIIRKSGGCVILIHGEIENPLTWGTDMLLLALQGG